ncbi:MAG: GtrA family protein [Rikenellaceae bacterium]
MKNKILKFVEWFYLPFIRRYVPIETFRYGFCGGANMVLDMVIYFLVYNFILFQKEVDLGFVCVTAEIAAFLITMPITFFTGFWLAKHISFKDESKKTNIQRIKYLAVVCINILTKYWGLKLFVEVFNVYASVSNALVTVITVIISYCLQKKYTFRKEK